MWIIRLKRAYGKCKVSEPKESGDYFVTDGTHVHLAHYIAGDGWGIYQPDKFGIIRNCYIDDDMNFDIFAYKKLEYPKIRLTLNNIGNHPIIQNGIKAKMILLMN